MDRTAVGDKDLAGTSSVNASAASYQNGSDSDSGVGLGCKEEAAVGAVDTNSENPHETCSDWNRETMMTSGTSWSFHSYLRPRASISLEVDLMKNVRSCDDLIASIHCCVDVERTTQSFPLRTTRRLLVDFSGKMNEKTIRDIRRPRAMEFYAIENLCTKLLDFADELVELLL